MSKDFGVAHQMLPVYAAQDALRRRIDHLTAERDAARAEAAWVRETMGRELVEERRGHADTLTALAAARAEAARLREALGEIARRPMRPFEAQGLALSVIVDGIDAAGTWQSTPPTDQGDTNAH